MYAARKNPIAFEYYDNVLRIDPTNQEALYARAKLLQDLGKTDEAIKEYESLTGAESQCETCHYNLGAIFLEIKKDNQKALKHFSKAIELNPSYAEAFFARGYTYARMGEKEKAKADYAACLKIVPNYEAAVQGLNEL
jgi:tetratricopeptide (TPR) repeat protein